MSQFSRHVQGHTCGRATTAEQRVDELEVFVSAYDAWQAGKSQADVDGDWLRIAPLYDAMVEARAALRPTILKKPEPSV